MARSRSPTREKAEQDLVDRLLRNRDESLDSSTSSLGNDDIDRLVAELDVTTDTLDGAQPSTYVSARELEVSGDESSVDAKLMRILEPVLSPASGRSVQTADSGDQRSQMDAFIVSTHGTVS